MKKLINIEKLYLASFMVSIIPLLISCITVYFMTSEIPMHYDLAGNIDRWGKNNEMIFIGGLFTIFAYGMSLLFHKINIHTYAKIIGQIGAIIMSLIFIILQFYFTINIFKVTGINIQNINWLSFSVTLIGLASIYLGISVRIFPIKKLMTINSEELLFKKGTLLLGIGGVSISIISALIKNIYSLIPFFIFILIFIIFGLWVYKRLKSEGV